MATKDRARDIDWNRWHELLDAAAARALTAGETAEFDQFTDIVAALDAEEASRAGTSVAALVREHRRAVAMLERLCDKTREEPTMTTEPTDTRKAITADLRHTISEIYQKIEAARAIIHRDPTLQQDVLLEDFAEIFIRTLEAMHDYITAHYKWD